MNRKTNVILSILMALGIPMLAPSLVNASEEQKVAANSTKRDRAYQIPSYSEGDRDRLLSQVTSISEFTDVAPDTWAFEALRNLVEEYGCIAGYPDRSYRGDRALTRYEFAAGMNACLQAFERRMLEGRGTTRPNEVPPQPGTSQDSLNEVFERAFFHNMDSFYESTGILDQINTQIGIYPFKIPAAFPENQIARDGELLHEIYKDALQQQSSLPNVRTRDLPNPFDTSLLENPGYIRPAAPDGRRELIIEQTP
jgi:hypothetical protein